MRRTLRLDAPSVKGIVDVRSRFSYLARMSKKDPIGVRLDADERVALEKAAADDDRPLSSLCRKIVAEWLREHGWLERGSETSILAEPKDDVVGVGPESALELSYRAQTFLKTLRIWNVRLDGGILKLKADEILPAAELLQAGLIVATDVKGSVQIEVKEEARHAERQDAP
jgi:hypothetical protein